MLVSLFLAASLLLGSDLSTNETSPGKPSVELPEGLSEIAVLEALVPGYLERVNRSVRCLETHAPGECFDESFNLRIAEVLDAGALDGGIRLVLVAVQGNDGECAQCHSAYCGLFELPNGRLLWRFGDVGETGPANLAIVKPMGNEGPILVQLDSEEGSQGNWYEETRYWFLPKLAGGRVTLEPYWSGLRKFARYGIQATGCGTFEWESRSRSFKQSLSTFYRNGAQCLYEPTWSDAEEDCYSQRKMSGLCGVVEIRSEVSWRVGLDRLEPVPDSAEIARLDHGQSELFPFSLPLRRGRYRLDPAPRRTSPAKRNAQRIVSSPSGQFVVSLEAFQRSGEVLIRKRDGKDLRRIKLNGMSGFDFQISGIGWAKDESRFFLDVEFGFQDRALLSFSRRGKNDFWEETRSRDSSVMGDGFVMVQVHIQDGKRSGSK